MANGSFGLSGLPSAPTTVTNSSGNSAISTEIITVSSASGFSNGDLIYQKNGLINRVADNAESTGTFDLNAGSPFSYLGTSSVNTFNFFGGNYRCPPADVLTNGNVVVVWIGSNNTPYYRIVSPANVIVVNDTQVSSAYNNTSVQKCTVAALKTGGFVVCWHGVSNNMAYQIHSNTGSVVTAAAQSGYILQPDSDMCVASTLNGSWIFGGTNTGTADMYYAIRNNTGASVLAWTLFGSTGSTEGANVNPVAARGLSSEFLVTRRASGGATVHYRVLNSTGGTIVSSSFAPASTGGGISATCLDNDTFVIGYGSGGSCNYRKIPIGNVLGSEVVTFTTGTINGNIAVKALTGNLILSIAYQQTTAYPLWNVFGSSDTKVSAATDNFILGGTFSSNGLVYYKWSAFSVAGSINLYYSTAYSQGGQPTAAANGGIAFFRIDSTTYRPIVSGTVASNVGQSSVAAVSGYGRGRSTPMTAAFLSATTQTLSGTVAASNGGSFLVSPITVEATGCISICVTTLQDGSYAVLYTTSAYVVKMAIYTALGVFSQTVTVASTNVYSVKSRNRITTLSNGKIVTQHASSSGAPVLTVFSTSFVQLAQITVSGTYHTSAAQYVSDIAALSVPSTSNFVFVYLDDVNTWTQYSIYSDALSLQNSGTVDNTATCSSVSVGASPAGSFTVVNYNSASSRLRLTGFVWAGGSTYLLGTAMTSYGNAGWSSYSRAVVGLPDGQFGIAVAGSGSPVVNLYQANGVSAQNFSTITASTNNCYSVVAATTGMGGFVYTDMTNPPRIMTCRGTSVVTCTMTGIDIQGVSSEYNYGVSPGYGFSVAIAYLQTATLYPRLCLVTPLAYTAFVSVVSGVTEALPSLPINPSTGYYMLGVATSDCPSGGTGTVQINGAAQLGPSYSASTAFQAFDFTNPTVFGVKGTVAGRNLTIMED